jgi:uncharacterized protein
VLTAADCREDFGEDRWIALGWMKPTVAVVVYVERSGDTIRIISARKATRPEVKRYGNLGHCRFTGASRYQGWEHMP